MHLEPHHVAALRLRYGSAYVTHALCDLHSNKAQSPVLALLGLSVAGEADAALRKHIAPHCERIGNGLDALAQQDYARLMEGIAQGHMRFNLDSIKKMLSNFAYRVVTSPRALVGALFAAAKQMVELLFWLFPDGTEEHESVQALEEQVESSADEREQADWSWSDVIKGAFRWLTDTLSKWVSLFATGLDTVVSWCVGWLGSAVEGICNGGIVKGIKGVAKQGFFIVFYCYNLISAGIQMGNRDQKQARAHLRACAGNLPEIVRAFGTALQGGTRGLLTQFMRVLAGTPLFQSLIGKVADVALQGAKWLWQGVTYVFNLLGRMLENIFSYAKHWAEKLLGDLLVEKLSYIANVVRRFATQLQESLPELPLFGGGGSDKPLTVDKVLEQKVADARRYVAELYNGQGLNIKSSDERHRYANATKKAIYQVELFIKEQREHQEALIHTAQSAWDAATIQSATWMGEDPLGTDRDQPNELRDRYFRHMYGYPFAAYNDKVAALVDALELPMFQQLSAAAAAGGKRTYTPDELRKYKPSEAFIGVLPSNYATLSVQAKIAEHEREISEIENDPRYGWSRKIIVNELGRFTYELSKTEDTIISQKAKEARFECFGRLDKLSHIAEHRIALAKLKLQASNRYWWAWVASTSAVVLASFGFVTWWVYTSSSAEAQAELEVKIAPVVQDLYAQQRTKVLSSFVVDSMNKEEPAKAGATTGSYLSSLQSYRSRFLTKIANTYSRNAQNKEFVDEVHAKTRQEVNNLLTDWRQSKEWIALTAGNFKYSRAELEEFGSQTFREFNPEQDSEEVRFKTKQHNEKLLKITKDVWSALTGVFDTSVTAVQDKLGKDTPLERFEKEERAQAFAGVLPYLWNWYSRKGGFGLDKSDLTNGAKVVDQVLSGEAIWVSQWLSGVGGGLLVGYAMVELAIVFFGSLVAAWYRGTQPLAEEAYQAHSYSGMIKSFGQKVLLGIAVPALFIAVTKIIVDVVLVTTVGGAIMAWISGGTSAWATVLAIGSGVSSVTTLLWSKRDWLIASSYAYLRAEPVLAHYVEGVDSVLKELWAIQSREDAERFAKQVQLQPIIDPQDVLKLGREIQARLERAQAVSDYVRKPEQPTQVVTPAPRPDAAEDNEEKEMQKARERLAQAKERRKK